MKQSFPKRCSAELLGETEILADELENAQTAEALRDIPDSYADLTKSLSRVDRPLRAHSRRLANQDFRPIIAVGGLLERIDFAAALGRTLAYCVQEALKIAHSIPAVVLGDQIILVRSMPTDRRDGCIYLHTRTGPRYVI